MKNKKNHILKKNVVLQRNFAIFVFRLKKGFS
jgi:hypothetical protein